MKYFTVDTIGGGYHATIKEELSAEIFTTELFNTLKNPNRFTLLSELGNPGWIEFYDGLAADGSGRAFWYEDEE